MRAPVLLDHAASTPCRPEALSAFADAARHAAGGNPASGHAAGRAARTILEEARERIALVLGRSTHEVVFTSGGTEADQLAVVGTFRAAAEQGRRHVVCSAVEHPAVRDAVTWLARTQGAAVTWVRPTGVMPLDVAAMLEPVTDATALVVMTGADGEVGVLQHSDALADACAARGVPLHTDAVQRLATSDVPTTGSLALTGHKLGAPAGIGVAVLPRDVPVRPLVDGPGQERGLRSGTQPVALAAALAVAVEGTAAERDEHRSRCHARTAALAAALADLPDITPTVPVDAPHRVASHLHLQVPGVDPEALATALDAVGVSVSTGTACATGSAVPSPVLAAYGLDADATLRCTVGRTTTHDEVLLAAARIDEVVAKLRAAGGGFL